jgi:dihydrofolate reductase
MRSVTYSMGVSLDGYIAGPDGDINWSPPDDEVFRSHIDEIRRTGVYPVMVGGGTPFFARHERRVDLELVETRTFGNGVVSLRHRVVR